MICTARNRNGKARPPARPKTADKIERIVAQQIDWCGEFVNEYEFYATVSNAHGQRLSVRMLAPELLLFSKFRKALLDRHGVWFDDSDRYAGKQGRANWSSAIHDLMEGVC